MNRLLDGLFVVIKVVVASCLAVMVVLVFTNVVLRYAFNQGITVSEELSSWLLVWVTFLAALIGLRDHAHLGFDGLLKWFPQWVQKSCLFIAQCMMLYAVYLVGWGSWLQSVINYDVTAPATGWSVAFLYGIGVFFGIVAAIILLRDMYRLVTGQLSEKELVMVKESADMAEAEHLAKESAKAVDAAEQVRAKR